MSIPYLTWQNIYTIPHFFKVKPGSEAHPNTVGQIIAVEKDQKPHAPGYVDGGLVSKRTPFGHGTGLGYPKAELTPATPDEIRAAIKKTHPCGWLFKPDSQAALDRGFHEVLSGSVSNWGKLFNPPSSAAEEEEREILRYWWNIARKQRKLLLAELKKTPVKFGALFSR